jgi:NDP-sugar pyrophosphorylase family protein
MDRTIIGDNTAVRESVIGRHATIRSTSRKQTKIDGVSVIADDVTVENGCILTNTKIYPHQYVRGEFVNQTLMQG